MGMQGTHRARAKQWVLNEINGKHRLTISFELTDGPHKGQSIVWDGYFTDATWQRTFDSMRHCGWEGTDVGDLSGLDKNEVELVIEQETYEGKLRDKVKWVNRLGGVGTRNALTGEALRSLADSMRSRATAHKQDYGKPRAQRDNGPPEYTDEDIPY